MIANTENERIYFALQKKIEYAAQLQTELNNEKATSARLLDQIENYEEEKKFTAERINNFTIELNSLQFLLTNIRASHVDEKEQLVNNITQLRAKLGSMEHYIADMVKKNSEDHKELRSEISTQNERIKVLNRTKNSLQARICQIQSVSVPPESGYEDLNNKTKKRPAKVKKLQKSKLAKVEQQYEVEKIMDHSVRHKEKLFMVRWKGYGSEHDSWQSEKDLDCPDLLQKYLASIANANPAQNA